ncbi:MAG: hypothetical protein HKN25_06555 [Pyrinomonadaceae bacterium]|nr:hypothetical protein [Pyrinomonadaceae bacterium]
MKTISRLFLVPILLFLSTCVFSQIDPQQDFVIKVRHSNKYLQPKQSSGKSGTEIVQGTPGDNGQRLRLVSVGKGYYKIVVKKSGYVLDVDGSSFEDGAAILQWPYNGTPNQQFRLEPSEKGFFSIVARHSGKLLDVRGASRDNGAPLIQWTRNDGHHQQFSLIPVSDTKTLDGIVPDGLAAFQSLENVRAELLNGVRRVAAPGVPGPLLLTAPGAVPIITSVGRNKTEQSVVAASFHGKGRVVAFGHPGFFSESESRFADTGRLLLNSVRWSAGGKRASLRVGLLGPAKLTGLIPLGGHTSRIVGPSDWEDGLRGFDVVIAWPSRLSKDQIEKLTGFVTRGGGLLAADLGWGWQQLNPGKDLLEENPSNRLLRSAGIAWIDGYAADPPNGYEVKKTVSPLANSSVALRRIQSTSNLLPVERLQAWLSVSQASVLPSYASSVDRYLASARNAPDFPGGSFPAVVSSSARRVTAVRSISAAKLNGIKPAWHSTGLYAAPGEVITVAVNESARGKGLAVQIGSHSDKLWHKDKWERFPDVIRSRKITGREVRLSNPFGGLIYITTPGRSSLGATRISFHGVIRAPSFEYGVDSLSEWKSRIRKYPAPWAELVSDNVVLTIPSETMRRIEDPVSLMRYWNRVLDLTADLAVIPRKRERPERIVTDKQISAGYMHSGYPIMTHLDAAERVASIKQLQSAWGIYHELGHNHQHSDWTFNGTIEVTCNLFTLYVREKATNTSPRKAFMDLGKRPAPEVYFEQQRRIPAAQKFDRWKKDPFLALAMYIQLQEAFGWDIYQRVFREYRTLSPRQRPKSDSEKRDQWMIRFSRATGYNLTRFFEEWGVPVSAKAKKEAERLPVWMP